MKAQWKRYLKEIGMRTALIKRIESAERAVAAVCPDQLRDLFVSEYLSQDGTRNYEHVFFFTDEHAIRVTNFLTEQTLDIDAIAYGIVNLVITGTDFDFGETSEKSRLTVHYHTAGGCTADLRASKENCAYLLNVVRRWLAPNLNAQSWPSAPILPPNE